MVFLPLYSLVMDWVFPLKLSYQIEYYYGFENTWCMSCVGYPWWQWGVLLIHLMYFLHSTRGFPRWHWGNLCIGVDARFHPCFFGRNLGALCEVLCVGLNIMNLKLFDAYRIIDPQILVVTLEYLGDIRVDWCVSYGFILLRTLGLFVTLIGIAQWIDRKE
mgnify:CR=1 FL=1